MVLPQKAHGCFHPNLWMAAMSVRGSKPFERAYWLQGSRDAGEVPSLHSLCARPTWGSGARTYPPTDTFTPPGNTQRPLCQSCVYLDCKGSGRESAKCAHVTSRLVPPIIGHYWGWPASSELLNVGCCAGQPEKTQPGISLQRPHFFPYHFVFSITENFYINAAVPLQPTLNWYLKIVCFVNISKTCVSQLVGCHPKVSKELFWLGHCLVGSLSPNLCAFVS